jgi:hypothetical protein
VTTDDLQYLAATIQFSAVPIGALEFMTPESRQRLESWLVTQLPKLLKSLLLVLALLYITVFLLVKVGPYVAIAYLLFGGLIATAVSLSSDNPMNGAILGWALGLVILIAAALEAWVLPASWVLAIASPFELFSTWANSFGLVDWLLPDYSASAFLKNYQDTFNRLENWLWSWLRYFYFGYFFFSRGLMLIAVIVIQLALVAGGALIVSLCLAIPVYLFIWISDRLKQRLHIAEGRIPIAAFVLFVIGETLDFGIQTFCRWTSGC